MFICWQNQARILREQLQCTTTRALIALPLQKAQQERRQNESRPTHN
jgi:hypothetical protein